MTDIFQNEYTITSGRLVKGMTGFVIILFLIIGILVPYSVYYEEGDIVLASFMTVLLISIFLPILIGAWIYSPKKYIVSEKGIRIIRPVGPIIIPIEQINSVEEKDINEFKTIRLWANGGLFSLTGAYYNKTDGKFWMYTKNNNYVMIQASKKYVLSPDEKERFIIEVKNIISRYGKKKK